MNKKMSAYAKIGLFIVLFVLIDQLTKYIATIYLKGKTDVSIIKNVFVLHYLDGGNTGAAWGLFAGKRILFLVFTILAVICISIFIRNIQNIIANNSLKSSKFFILQYLLALLLAGAVGNFIDRIIHGYVIDFIYFELIHFPVFNVADCYVTVSCFFIICLCLTKLDEDDFNKIFTLKRNQETMNG